MHSSPSKLKDGDEGAVVEEARPLPGVVASDTNVENERKAAGDQHRSEQMPRFPLPVATQQLTAVVAVGLEADERRGERVGDLAEQQQSAGDRSTKLQIEVEQRITEPDRGTKVVEHVPDAEEYLRLPGQTRSGGFR